MTVTKTLICVVGARPNFMKIAPIVRALKAKATKLNLVLIHTGQHYDQTMKAQFFDQLGIPEPDKDLEVGAGSLSVQTAEIMKRFEPEVDYYKPDAVLVVGDVNSTIACALVSAQKKIRVVHVEAGLRSRDRTMPEEINRVLTDQLSDRLYTTEKLAEDNLAAEGLYRDKVVFAGNVMIDTLKYNLAQAKHPSELLTDNYSIIEKAGHYSLLTLHRPSNVDNPEILQKLLAFIKEAADKIPVVFPIHPRTQKNIQKFKLSSFLEHPQIIRLSPVGYLEMLGLMNNAKLVLTDSGGIQEETTALGIPCLTLRENTERPITVSEGTNTIVGSDITLISKELDQILQTGGKAGRTPALWDGHAAERIADDLLAWL
ncbi:non-hydrolyzing UDP-N-acetylglucosamine 2-epimerase [Spartinivicinus poritis]|uniref:UDP-N-acetylglucosamine 2-epimerase (Non-hydrolyzing) n=1 Tax=Spartinivicinus poritis TaxID=2994640 RepID=A0ABT5UDZ7_9GAMM|nr:UDP-N-acetylglucosamine 2-epimerase (non-hydrolyzing) [Spartinivicinus sp. A2-2]MDE1464604.1 UDP-N-acetylglucosamine 2-epimerase (non-hydrolyzing) [Spartinivicinus sp. A2-2]